MRLGIKDHKVIRAFTEHRSLSGHKLSTDGKRLDGHWLGGSRIADWQGGQIYFHDLGSKAAESVQKQIRYHAAPNQLASRDVKRSVGKRRKRGEHGPRRMGHTTIEGMRYEVPDYRPHVFRKPQESKSSYMHLAKHYAKEARRADQRGDTKNARKYREHARKLLRLAKRYRGVFSRDRQPGRR